jgi:hypothetical protein
MNKRTKLACRLREVRQNLYGEIGLPKLARALEIPVETWLNYERGVTMPAHVLLAFLEISGVEPQSLVTEEDLFPTIQIDL